jgi:hypothetical protein
MADSALWSVQDESMRIWLMCMLLLCTMQRPVISSLPISLVFDPMTGAWTRLCADGRNLLCDSAPDVEIFWSEGHLPPVNGWKQVSQETRGATAFLIYEGKEDP